MPLFGKKKKEESKKKEAAAGGYPQQPPQQGYAFQPAAYPTQPAMQPAGAAYAGAPPPYSAHPTAPHQTPGGPQAQAPPPGYQAQPNYSAPTPQSTVYVQDGFEAGARFGVGSQPSIPPPPPGCAPNAAQMALMQGQNVIVSQQKGSFMSGTGDGGYCVW